MRQLKIDVLSVLVVTDKLEFDVVGARDFSPEITVHITGTEVPCFEKFPDKFQFVVESKQYSLIAGAINGGARWIGDLPSVVIPQPSAA